MHIKLSVALVASLLAVTTATPLVKRNNSGAGGGDHGGGAGNNGSSYNPGGGDHGGGAGNNGSSYNPGGGAGYGGSCWLPGGGDNSGSAGCNVSTIRPADDLNICIGVAKPGEGNVVITTNCLFGANQWNIVPGENEGVQLVTPTGSSGPFCLDAGSDFTSGNQNYVQISTCCPGSPQQK
ncbi:hypothetical protein QFC19_006166 [Naganishia cerealis]|uniref:Uncharacterized protein n=1 Tax=Naganishia cerealis TaxID=610337 RepID=A0ACC2VK68_9TREE|nr:hypothetical protein QFC19_006166 [Naganishia cerealis]